MSTTDSADNAPTKDASCDDLNVSRMDRHKMNMEILGADTNTKMWCFQMAIQRAANSGKQGDPIPDMAVIIRDADLVYRWFDNDEVPEASRTPVLHLATTKPAGEA